MSTPLTDPREIRKLLHEAAYLGVRIDQNPEYPKIGFNVHAVVRNSFKMAELFGLTGEDKMTMVAYHALLQCEQLTDRLLEIAMTSTPNIIVKHQSPPCEPAAPA